MSDPRLDVPPAKPEFVCEFCGQSWKNRFSAAMCCDVVSYDLGYD